MHADKRKSPIGETFSGTERSAPAAFKGLDDSDDTSPGREWTPWGGIAASTPLLSGRLNRLPVSARAIRELAGGQTSTYPSAVGPDG